MRIAYVCADPGVPVFGRKGCSIHVQEVIRALLSRGVDIDLFATRLDGERPGDLANVRAHALPAPTGRDAAARGREMAATNERLAAELYRSGPFDAVYERYSLWIFAGMEYARNSGTPGVLEVNAPLIEEQEEHRGLEDRKSAERAERRCFAAASALVAVSKELASVLERHPAARGRVHVVPNGVSAERFHAGVRPSRAAAPGVFTVGFVGSLKPWHGLSVLVDAFALLHGEDERTRLLIVGDGGGRPALEAQISERGLEEAVCLTGSVDPAEVPGLLASMDVAVAPYPPRSPFYFSPLKVCEYMAAGLPVVTSRIGQLVELLEEGRCGVLCPPGDPAALADALADLRRDPDRRRRFGARARAKVLRDHTWDGVARRILTLARSGQARSLAAGG